MDYRTLATTPSLPDGDSQPRSRIQVAVLADDFTDPRYGDFAITTEHVANWQRLLASQFGGKVHIDLDHGTDYGTGTGSEAAGWIVALDQNGADGLTATPDEVWALVEWTPLGVEKVQSKAYQWISPTFTDDYVDNRGQHHGPALARAGLTNDPFLREMATVSLSGGSVAYRRGASGEGSDSRGQMPDLTKIAEALSLTKDADEAKVLSAIQDLADQATKAKQDAPADTKTLKARMEAEGLVVLSRDDHAALKADALAGKTAAEDLRVSRFEAAFDKVLSEARVPTDDDTRSEWRELYDAAPDVTLKRLSALQPLASLKAQGHGGADGDTPDLKAEGYDTGHVDEDRAVQLDEVRKFAAEHNLDFRTAARQVLARTA